MIPAKVKLSVMDKFATKVTKKNKKKLFKKKGKESPKVEKKEKMMGAY